MIKYGRFDFFIFLFSFRSKGDAMRNACYVVLLFLAFGQVASASPEPNFNGTWVLDQINGKPVPSEVIRFSITLKGNEFVIEFPGSPNKQEYVLDGTERILPTIGTPIVTYYTAKWDGESLIIDKKSEDTRPWPGPFSSFDRSKLAMHTHQVWSISDDGKNLIRLTTVQFGTSSSTVETADVFTKMNAQ
jgi:hypothetical protein